MRFLRVKLFIMQLPSLAEAKARRLDRNPFTQWVVQQATNARLQYSYKTDQVKVLTLTHHLYGTSTCILSEYNLNILYNVPSSKVEAFFFSGGFRLSNLQVKALTLSKRKCFFAMKGTTIMSHSDELQ